NGRSRRSLRPHRLLRRAAVRSVARAGTWPGGRGGAAGRRCVAGGVHDGGRRRRRPTWMVPPDARVLPAGVPPRGPDRGGYALLGGGRVARTDSRTRA